MHNTQSRLPVNDNDVITLGATIGTFEAVVFFFGAFVLGLCAKDRKKNQGLFYNVRVQLTHVGAQCLGLRIT